MKRKADLYIKDIEISVKKIEKYTKNISFDTFVKIDSRIK